MTEKVTAKVHDVEDGILHIPPQMKFVEVIQYLKTYKNDIKQLHIRDRSEGMKKILKEIEHLPNLEFIEIKHCNIGVDTSKRNLKDVFKGIFDRCTKLKQIVYEHTDRRQSGHADLKTMIKKKGSTIVEIGVQSEATVEPEKKTWHIIRAILTWECLQVSSRKICYCFFFDHFDILICECHNMSLKFIIVD